MTLFKLLGLLFIFLSFSGFGFFKAFSLKQRAAALEHYLKGLFALADYVAVSKSEAAPLLSRCFGEKRVQIKNGEIYFSKEGLSSQDFALLKEFFDGFGRQSGEEEARRCHTFAKLFEQKCAEAEKNFQKLFKLYGSLGVLSGLFICIFLM